jgi:hypothetical protein
MYILALLLKTCAHGKILGLSEARFSGVADYNFIGCLKGKFFLSLSLNSIFEVVFFR